MKKITLAAIALLASAAVFADGFKLSGYLRAGYSSTFGDHATQTTKTWLAGDYWGGKTRSRINVNWDSADGTSGAFMRLQYSGAADEWELSDSNMLKYADAYAKILDKKAIVVAGKLYDNFITSDGFEGFSLADGKSGFFAALTPVQGLTVGGGSVSDYKKAASSETTDTQNETDKKAAFGGFKYTNDKVTVDGGYAGIGALYGNINITAVKGLLVALEYAHETDDCLDDFGTNLWYNSENTFCEQVEYTGIEKLTLGFLSYQYLNDHGITDDSNTKVTLTPAVSYAINKTFAVSVEGTYTVYDYDDSPDNYGFVVPALQISADDTATVYIWGEFSSDQDQTTNCMGVGVKKSF